MFLGHHWFSTAEFITEFCYTCRNTKIPTKTKCLFEKSRNIFSGRQPGRERFARGGEVRAERMEREMANFPREIPPHLDVPRRLGTLSRLNE